MNDNLLHAGLLALLLALVGVAADSSGGLDTARTVIAAYRLHVASHRPATDGQLHHHGGTS